MADLIDRDALLAAGNVRKMKDALEDWDTLDNKTKIIVLRYAKAHKKLVESAPAVNPFEHLQEMICEGCNQQFSNEPCEPDECFILAAFRTYAKETDFCSSEGRRTDATD
jgi:hypothetical protein